MTNQFNTPWVTGDSRSIYTFINDAKGVQMSVMETNAAKHIVRCVNSHDQLVSALTLARGRMLDMMRQDDGQAYKEAERAMPQIEKALAAARVKP